MGEEMKDLSLLVTGAGAPGFPGITKALRKNGERNIRIVATDMKPDVVGYYLADAHYQVPPGDVPSYIDEMLKIVEKEKIDVVLPLCTNELLPLARNVKRFEEIGAKVLVSKPESLEIAINKGKLYSYLKGEFVPEFYIAKTVEEFEEAAERLGYPEKPFVFKPTISHGSRGFRIVMPNVDRKKILFEQKPTNVYASYDEIIKVLEDGGFPELVVMEYLPGDEYSIDMVGKDGDTIYTVPRKRVEIKQGISYTGIIEKNEELIEASNEVYRQLKLDYNINMQFKKSLDGTFKIIEINPRVSGSLIFCVGAGVNLPYFGVKLLLGEEIPKVEIKWGTRVYRHWEEIFVYNDSIFRI